MVDCVWVRGERQWLGNGADAEKVNQATHPPREVRMRCNEGRGKREDGRERRGKTRTAELVGDKLVGRLDAPHVLHVAVQGEQILLICWENKEEEGLEKYLN